MVHLFFSFMSQAPALGTGFLQIVAGRFLGIQLMSDELFFLTIIGLGILGFLCCGYYWFYQKNGTTEKVVMAKILFAESISKCPNVPIEVSAFAYTATSFSIQGYEGRMFCADGDFDWKPGDQIKVRLTFVDKILQNCEYVEN